MPFAIHEPGFDASAENDELVRFELDLRTLAVSVLATEIVRLGAA